MGIERLQKIRTSIIEEGLDALMVSQPENRRYLSGFTGSSGYLFISKKRAILATDFRYIEQAKIESPYFEVVRIKGAMENWFPPLISDLACRKLGFESNFISYDSYLKLNKAIASKQLNLELTPISGLVEHLRRIKEPGELDLIASAALLIDSVFEEVKELIRPGMTEKDAAWEIEQVIRSEGSEGIPFDIIIASGPNSALPHARPTERIIRTGEPVLLDMGASIGDYCSDFSRTLCWGHADKTLQEIYNIVLKAQLAAIEGIISGMNGAQVDRLARSVIEDGDYGYDFGHGLGHGVGLAEHESPGISPNSTDILSDGMVFTIEPGIYLAGWGGVRIEDMVVLEDGKARVLTKSGKDSFQLSIVY